ncbi:unnamed protein product, partial [Urochloa humidicola]
MPLADSLAAAGGVEAGAAADCSGMAVEEIVQHPLPGYAAPVALSFCPDDRRVACLYSPDGTLHRKVYTFDIGQHRQELLFGPPDGGGLEEGRPPRGGPRRRRGAASSRWPEAAARGGLLDSAVGEVVVGEGRRAATMDSAVGEVIAAAPELLCSPAISAPPRLPLLLCSSPVPPAPLLRSASPTPGHLPSRREGVHLCISSLIGRQFASPFASAVGGEMLKAQLRAGG